MSDKRTVLVVDDDDAIQLGTRLRLCFHGFDVELANDGAEAIALALALQPDMILMDIRMPVMDGLTALRHLKNNPKTKDIPVVIASASAEHQASSLDTGASFFLRKPYSNEALLATMAPSAKFNQPTNLYLDPKHTNDELNQPFSARKFPSDGGLLPGDWVGSK